MPAYAYLRKSSVHDPAREVSYELQESAVRDLAARNGDNHGSLTILSDWDKSGRLGADKRPGYRALLAAIESGDATAVYSYSLSRLGRSLPELARLIADCDQRGIPVRLSADPVDTSTASGRLLTHVLASVAQFEADVASERVRAANATKRANGRPVGTAKPYGAKDGEDGQLVLAAFREAGSYSGAAKLLNQRRIKPRTSKRAWWPSSVAVVVKRLDPSVGVRRPSRGYAAGGTDFFLARLLRCPTCGTMLTGTRDRLDGPNKGRVRYACRLGTVTPHPRISISEHLILPAIQAEAAHLALPEAVTESADREERASLESRRLRIIDSFEAGHLTREERDERLEAVYAAVEKLDARRVVTALPAAIEWSWVPKKLNAALRALFRDIELDAETFRPTAFTWWTPEWRR